MAAAEPVRVARGQPGDKPCHQCRFGATAGRQFLPDPRVYPGLGKAGAAPDRARSDRPIGVRPGWTLKARMPLRCASAAMFSVNLMTAALETE